MGRAATDPRVRTVRRMNIASKRNAYKRRASAAVAALLSAALLAGACSTGAKSSAKKTGPTATTEVTIATTTASGGIDPNGPEVNPAGDIPDNQAFVAYSPPSGGYSVKVPEGWARSESGAAVTFTDKLNSIRMETVAAPNAPTVSSAERDEVPAIKAASKNYEAGKVTAITRTSGSVILIAYRADSAPNAVTGKVIHLDVERYEFWRGGNEVVLTLSGPVGADNVDPWRIVTDAFGWQ